MIWLDNARIAAILAVVILHSAVSGVVDTDLGSGYWWAGNLYSAFSRWCVPVFVMISGALLLSPARQESLGTFYRKRMSRVLWPFLFWSAFFLGWTLVKGIAKGKPPAPGLLALRFASGDEALRAEIHARYGDALYEDFGRLKPEIEAWLKGDADNGGDDDAEADQAEAAASGLGEGAGAVGVVVGGLRVANEDEGSAHMVCLLIGGISIEPEHVEHGIEAGLLVARPERGLCPHRRPCRLS